MHGPTPLRSTGRVAVLAILALVVLAAPAAANTTYTVDVGGEGHDINLGDGICDADEGPKAPCPLRAAVEEANAPPIGDSISNDVINIDVPAVQLTLVEGGALEITSNIQFNGVYSSQPSITQESSPGTGDRVFDVAAGTVVGLDNLTISGGEANAGNNFFGGNIQSRGNLTIRNSSIENGSGDSAGGVANRGGTLTIESSTVTGNKAPTAPGAGGDAGAILNFGEGGPATLTIRSSTISGNDARLGGGITSYNDPGNAITITDSTIAFNDSGDRGSGGGLAVGSGTATVRNTILAKNTSTVAGQEDCSADPGTTISSAGHNLEGATSCGFTSGSDKRNTDPLLGQLAFNGGPTRTHAIGPGSPAFDSGDPACLPADQRGAPRPQGPGCDIGAFEAPDQAPPETAIGSAPTGRTTDHTPTFAFSAGEAGSRFECSIDGGPFEPCTSPFTTPPLTAGSHTLAVRAVDPAGNVDPTPSVVEFVIAAVTVDELPKPVQGVVVNVAEVSGTVLVGLQAQATGSRGSARASQKGIKFVPLSEAEQIPVGSFLDTRKGTVEMQSAANRRGKRQTGRFRSGLFQVRQSRKRSARGLTDLVLKGSSFRSCRPAGRGKKASASLSRRQIRRLRANARGRFRTSGSNSSATVRGTIWDITDRCDGTLTHVTRGKVIVRDFRRKKNITLTSGKSYLAKPRS